MSKLFLGADIGTSSIKVALWDAETGRTVGSAYAPSDFELPIDSPHPGWAEQDPDTWWTHLTMAVAALPIEALQEVEGIGISYQMHGLVLVGEDMRPVRPAIIWCDGRAARDGEEALASLGKAYCYEHLLNSPGNFTASKLRWVLVNEPETLRKVKWAMLPGDYIALRLTGHANTTASGLSEMILWDFKEERIAEPVLEDFQLSSSILPPLVPTFGVQGFVSAEAAAKLAVRPGTPVSYRAGDQPNNAFSLGCLNAGDVAATAGTSGVVYGVLSEPIVDYEGRFNTFLHVNHRFEYAGARIGDGTSAPRWEGSVSSGERRKGGRVPTQDERDRSANQASHSPTSAVQNPGLNTQGASFRYGALLCINGCGSLYCWLRSTVFGGRFSYSEMNELAASAPVGSDGLRLYPFGNGAERILQNRDIGASVASLDFRRHDASHLCRAAQEAISFALRYGMETGIEANLIRAGNANMFLSKLFAQTFSSVTGAAVEIWDTDGATGAARGAAVGTGYFTHPADAFESVGIVAKYEPADAGALESAYQSWRAGLPL